MADFPNVSGVISEVISSVVPPRAYIFMVAVLPGLFFEISILLANPALFCELIARARDGFGLSHYETLGLSLALAFVIGNAFILLVTLIQRLLGYLYRLLASLWQELCAWPLLPLTDWLQKKRWWAKRRWLTRLFIHVRSRHLPFPMDEGARRLWAIVARRLLREKYGIHPKDLGQEEWNALYAALGTLTITDIRGSMTMIVSEATGWCGLAATLFALQLRNRYYVAFSVLLILSGMLHDWHVAGGLNNPQYLAVLKIRSLLREFRIATDHGGRHPLRTSTADSNADSASEPKEV
jgi:hypothetical protein